MNSQSRRHSRRGLAFALIAATTITASFMPADAADALGPPFQIIPTDTRTNSAVVARSGFGDFVVAWQHSDESVLIQRFDANGQAVGEPIVAKPSGDGRYVEFDSVRIAMNSSGEFVVLWLDQFGFQLITQTYGADGTPGSRFVAYELPQGALGNDVTGDVAIDDDGDLTVAWTTRQHRLTCPIAYTCLASGGEKVGARRFHANGSPIGGAKTLASYQTPVLPRNGANFISAPGVATDSTGNAVVVWSEFDGRTRVTSVYGRAIDATGKLQGQAFRVDDGNVSGLYAAIAMDDLGDYEIVWTTDRVQGRKYRRGSRPTAPIVGAAIDISGVAAVGAPRIDMNGTGDAVVTWLTRTTADPATPFASARAVGTDGSPLGDVLSASDGSRAYAPDVGIDDSARFVVTWNTDELVGSIFARLYPRQ